MGKAWARVAMGERAGAGAHKLALAGHFRLVQPDLVPDQPGNEFGQLLDHFTGRALLLAARPGRACCLCHESTLRSRVGVPLPADYQP